ncbi:nuclear transport factor 2 family protein [Rhodococcus qingshengii]|uniref:nuclear transport factor 2 family protein n=1 Tax=Rhodococcus qingshengii TaxID=334542 RepID=UPI001BE9459A|nr:nuclear transport factor 2 family protein [Rhodococcus qingshengii]MBT2269968.1 nuclear transport factor 2 family protein [Rhodococcus qingshengii]
MSTPTVNTVAEAEAAWTKAFTGPTTQAMRPLLHQKFVAVHGPHGSIDDAETFLANAEAKPRPSELVIFDPVVHEFADAATVSCLQQYSLAFVPGIPHFVIQAAVTRMWIREGGVWLLAHLQMARRITPG